MPKIKYTSNKTQKADIKPQKGDVMFKCDYVKAQVGTLWPPRATFHAPMYKVVKQGVSSPQIVPNHLQNHTIHQTLSLKGDIKARG
jgi:hypothetical protein